MNKDIIMLIIGLSAMAAGAVLMLWLNRKRRADDRKSFELPPLD